MPRKTLIEAILIWVISIITIIEGVRLTFYKDPYTLYDPLGPGLYTLFLGVALLATGIVLIAVNYRRDRIVEKMVETQKMKKKVMTMVGVCAMYIFLIEIVGYVLASLVFFLIMFRVVRIKSWKANVILACVITAAYYFTFVYYGGMIFPRGIIFE